jgi:hypothetical protein
VHAARPRSREAELGAGAGEVAPVEVDPPHHVQLAGRQAGEGRGDAPEDLPAEGDLVDGSERPALEVGRGLAGGGGLAGARADGVEHGAADAVAREGGEARPAARVEAADGAEQAVEAEALEVRDVDAARDRAEHGAGDAVDERKVRLDERALRRGERVGHRWRCLLAGAAIPIRVPVAAPVSAGTLVGIFAMRRDAPLTQGLTHAGG